MIIEWFRKKWQEYLSSEGQSEDKRLKILLDMALNIGRLLDQIEIDNHIRSIEGDNHE